MRRISCARVRVSGGGGVVTVGGGGGCGARSDVEKEVVVGALSCWIPDLLFGIFKYPGDIPGRHVARESK
ncbi:hypothetical protein Tco_0887217 [Tanacetum coccineum]